MIHSCVVVRKVSVINSFMTEAVIRANQCRANQWTGLYMITASFMKELNKRCIKTLVSPILAQFSISISPKNPSFSDVFKGIEIKIGLKWVNESFAYSTLSRAT